MQMARFAPALRLAAVTVFIVAAALLAQPAAAQETVTVDVGDIWFCDVSFMGGVCDTTIAAGDTVVWDFGPALLPHTTTACGASCDSPTSDPLWDSGLIVDGSTYQYTFTQPGTYLYYCLVHLNMQRGRIIVLGGGATPPPTPSSTGASGDVNCSGAVDSIDAALVLQLGAGLVGSLSCQQNADTNEDGSVNSIDAALILQHTAGLLPSLPP